MLNMCGSSHGGSPSSPTARPVAIARLLVWAGSHQARQHQNRRFVTRLLPIILTLLRLLSTIRLDRSLPPPRPLLPSWQQAVTHLCLRCQGRFSRRRSINLDNRRQIRLVKDNFVIDTGSDPVGRNRKGQQLVPIRRLTRMERSPRATSATTEKPQGLDCGLSLA